MAAYYFLSLILTILLCPISATIPYEYVILSPTPFPDELDPSPSATFEDSPYIYSSPSSLFIGPVPYSIPSPSLPPSEDGALFHIELSATDTPQPTKSISHQVRHCFMKSTNLSPDSPSEHCCDVLYPCAHYKCHGSYSCLIDPNGNCQKTTCRFVYIILSKSPMDELSSKCRNQLNTIQYKW